METWKGGQDQGQTYAEYKQRALNEKNEKNEKALGKHVINLYSTGISRVVKIRDNKKLQLDIKNDPIIRDQMANLGCLLVCVFGNFHALVLVAVHTVNNLDLDFKKASFLCLLARHKKNCPLACHLYVIAPGYTLTLIQPREVK